MHWFNGYFLPLSHIDDRLVKIKYGIGFGEVVEFKTLAFLLALMVLWMILRFVGKKVNCQNEL